MYLTAKSVGRRRHSSGAMASTAEKDCSVSYLPSASSWTSGQVPAAGSSACERPVCAGVVPRVMCVTAQAGEPWEHVLSLVP